MVKRDYRRQRSGGRLGSETRETPGDRCQGGFVEWAIDDKDRVQGAGLGKTQAIRTAGVRQRGAPVGRSVFISYTTHSDADLAARERLCDILGPMCHVRTLDGDPWEIWVDDRSLNAGDDWNQRLGVALDEASLFVVVMSEKYLNSTFCRDTELPRMLERHLDDKVPVLGVWLDGVNLKLFKARLVGGDVMGLDERQCLPRGPKGNGLLAVRKWDDKDDAWNKVAEEIERAWPSARTPKLKLAPRHSSRELKLPYFCDRRQQLRTLRQSLRDWHNPDAQRRPLLLLHEAHDHDSPDAWVTRLAVGELEAAMPAVTGRKVLSFGEPRVFAWPDMAANAADALQDLCDALSHKLISRLADWPDIHAAQHKHRQPTLWWTEVPECLEAGQVEHAAEALGAMLAQWPDRQRGTMLVVVVHVSAAAPEAAKQTVVERLGGAARTSGRFHLVDLGPLSPVSREDLRPWADDTHVRAHLARLSLDLDVLREQLGSGLPMRAFVQLFETLCGQSDR